MALIPKVGRKSLKTRLIIASLYLVLTAGAVTMVYPFLLMLASSVTSGADVNSYSVVPKYLYKTNALFPKYADDRYAGNIELINSYYGTDFAKVEDIKPPQTDASASQVNAHVKDWDSFLRSLPIKYKQAGFEGYAQSPSKLGDAYRDFCRKRFNDDIHLLNKTYIEEDESFEGITTPFERFKMREWEPDNSAKMQDWIRFKSKLPTNFLRPILIDPIYQAFLRDSVYDGSIARLNAAWGASYEDFNSIHIAPNVPSQITQAKDWERFMREAMPFRYMRVSPGAAVSYRSYLGEKYANIDDLNGRYHAAYTSFDQIQLPAKTPKSGARLVDWMDFIAKRVAVSDISAINTENLYRAHLMSKYGSIEDVNKAVGANYGALLDISPPVYLADWHFVKTGAGSLRADYLTRNYKQVINYIFLHGRAVSNTFIFVFLVVLTQLIVNPACAYALSRYNLSYSHKVLLFLLATMAFPAEVAMIPSFLLLKQFHLLNTYWALVLPGMANGYSIFLLKGFFDSLPKELYEAGMIDGASEITMFRKITIPMSKPIFAVIALHAFTGAYGAFMYAMLVCQDPKMWTLMVWLYQLQATAPQYVTMAALTVAALPTLLVFVFTQNVIMRGIIIPSYK